MTYINDVIFCLIKAQKLRIVRLRKAFCNDEQAKKNKQVVLIFVLTEH